MSSPGTRRGLPYAGSVIKAGAAALAVLLLAACSGSKTAAPMPVSPQDVALQASDVPAGFTICPQSGDVDHFLQLSTADSVIYQEIRADWAALKKQGAQQGFMRVYTNKPDQCAGIFAAGSASDPTLKVIASLAVQFKNSADAVTGYSSGPLAALGLGPGVTSGSATGLGTNSTIISQSFQSQALFFAYWQNGIYDLVVLALNMPTADARRISGNVNARVH